MKHNANAKRAARVKAKARSKHKSAPEPVEASPMPDHAAPSIAPPVPRVNAKNIQRAKPAPPPPSEADISKQEPYEALCALCKTMEDKKRKKIYPVLAFAAFNILVKKIEGISAKTAWSFLDLGFADFLPNDGTLHWQQSQERIYGPTDSDVEEDPDEEVCRWVEWDETVKRIRKYLLEQYYKVKNKPLSEVRARKTVDQFMDEHFSAFSSLRATDWQIMYRAGHMLTLSEMPREKRVHKHVRNAECLFCNRLGHHLAYCNLLYHFIIRGLLLKQNGRVCFMSGKPVKLYRKGMIHNPAIREKMAEKLAQRAIQQTRFGSKYPVPSKPAFPMVYCSVQNVPCLAMVMPNSPAVILNQKFADKHSLKYLQSTPSYLVDADLKEVAVAGWIPGARLHVMTTYEDVPTFVVSDFPYDLVLGSLWAEKVRFSMEVVDKKFEMSVMSIPVLGMIHWESYPENDPHWNNDEIARRYSRIDMLDESLNPYSPDILRLQFKMGS